VLVARWTQMPDFRYDRRRGSFKGLLKRSRATGRWIASVGGRRESNGDKLPELLADDPFDKLFEDEWARAVYEAALERGAPQRQVDDFRIVPAGRAGTAADRSRGAQSWG